MLPSPDDGPCNSYADFTADWNPGAITVAESGEIVVQNNTLKNNVSGVSLTQTHRPAPGETWLADQVAQGNVPNLTLHHVVVKDNVLQGNDKVGASHGPSGAGEADYASITFSNNSYDAPAQMEFWWQAKKHTYSEWQALGLR